MPERLQPRLYAALHVAETGLRIHVVGLHDSLRRGSRSSRSPSIERGPDRATNEQCTQKHEDEHVLIMMQRLDRSKGLRTCSSAHESCRDLLERLAWAQSCRSALVVLRLGATRVAWFRPVPQPPRVADLRLRGAEPHLADGLTPSLTSAVAVVRDGPYQRVGREQGCLWLAAN